MWKCNCVSDKATHPTNRQEDWEYIIGFCDQVNKELEGFVLYLQHVIIIIITIIIIIIIL